MSLRTSATRYARALFEIAREESDVDRVGHDLGRIVSALHGHEELRRVLTGGAVPRAVRHGVAAAVADRLELAPVVSKLAVLLADRGRVVLLPEIAVVFGEHLLRYRNIARVQVTSATPLAPDRLTRLTERLSAITGKAVQIEAGVDPALIGGLVARIGSTVYDGSVQTQLQRLRRSLVEPQP